MIGDKWYYEGNTGLFVIEEVEGGKQKLLINENNTHNYEVGMVATWPIDRKYWKRYYDKSEKFKDLWERLQ